MRLFRLLPLLAGLFILIPCAAGAQTQKPPPKTAPGRLTPEIIFAADSSGRQAADLAWSPDGRLLAYVWKDEDGKALWILDPATGRKTRVLNADKLGQDGKPPAVESFQWSPTGKSLLLVAGGDLYLQGIGGGPLRRLTDTQAEESDPTFSPDGSRLAFVRAFDLHLLDLATGRERALTTGGEENVSLNGINDWVYWEEIWDREPSAYWWSPDGKRIAYYHFDESPVGTYPLTVESDPAGPSRVKWQKYPRPGEPNPKVKIGILDVDGPSPNTTAWAATGDEDTYLARLAWTPDSRAVAIQRLNRDQTRIDLLRCDAGSGACSPIDSDTWPTWVNLGTDFRFLPDGRFVWGSEKSGWRRLYLHGADGRTVRPVSPEGWAVTSLDGIADDGSWLIFSGYRTAYRPDDLGPADRHVVRVRLADGSFDVLTPEAGWHEADVAPHTGSWVHTWSDADHPEHAEIRGSDGKTLAELPAGPPSGFDPAALPRWQFTTIPGPEGSRLPARLLQPAGFDPSRRYPVIVYHYGGPASQVVIDRWDSRGRDLWHKMMAQRGFVVAMVDNQSSLFFGKAGEDRDHRGMGAGNLAAQLALVDYLKSQSWVDADRIGLWGWSGGGFNTLYCLLHHPGVWKAGVAGAPVTDWRLYDSIWTERYLDTPQDNPDGYRASSPWYDADKLRDHLLVIHGLADDNVHPQNTVALSDRLIKAGIPFEQGIYPGQKHGFRGESQTHVFARMAEFFERTLQQVEVTDVEVR